MHLLEAKGLSKYYGKRHVVKGLNLYVSTGEIVGLLGPNGAGKTTTFYMMVGLIKPDGGKIFLDNEDLTGLPMYRRSLMGISYLPQEPSIFRKLTVEDNLRAVLEIRGLRQDEISVEVDRLLKEFNLVELAKKDGYRLSGGERRKTEIARAIAIKPRFLLFDEPFAGIDPIAIIELKKMLNYLKGRGLGILITDHNVRETLSITDRAYIINNGEILEEGSPDKLICRPEGERSLSRRGVYTLMALENRLELRLSQKLVLTPQLQQAIKLLQLPHLELTEFLNQELMENPFLEESVDEIPADELTPEEKDLWKGKKRPLQKAKIPLKTPEPPSKSS